MNPSTSSSTGAIQRSGGAKAPISVAWVALQTILLLLIGPAIGLM